MHKFLQFYIFENTSLNVQLTKEEISDQSLEMEDQKRSVKMTHLTFLMAGRGDLGM